MNILIADEDWRDSMHLERLLKKALPAADIRIFDNTEDALDFARKNPLGAAFIDMGSSIHVPGYFLAKKILELQRTNIILTSYEWKHTQDALELRVSGYMIKPLRYEEILTELQNLRYPLEQAGQAAGPRPAAPDISKHRLLERIVNLF